MVDTGALFTVVLYTGLAGLAVPVGGIAAKAFRLHEGHVREDILHFMIAFGGGALLSAVALVLLPEGTHGMGLTAVVLAFLGGALVFLLIDHAIEKRGGQFAQLMAMLMDAVPESLALGAAIAMGGGVGTLLAILVGVQNFPEGFNAFRELKNAGKGFGASLSALVGVAIAGVVAGVAGFLLLADRATLLGGLMVFASGGVVYLLFHDIAPEAHRKGHWAPTMGAVAGFALGLAGAVGAGLM